MRSILFFTLVTLLILIPMWTVADSVEAPDEAMVVMEISGMS